MSFLQAISDFFESLFNRNSPEVQKKLQMKKLENELKYYEPAIFKNGKLLPNFAEALRILYINTKPLNNLLDSTITSSDIPRNKRFEAQLVITGFSAEYQKMIESLSYEERKKELTTPSSMTTSQLYDIQRKKLERIIHELNSDTFKQIDKEIETLHQLADFCRFNFVTALQIFDPEFMAANIHYQPSYKELPVSQVTNILEDIYFQLKGLNLTSGTLNAVIALAQLKTVSNSKPIESEEIEENLKKIAWITHHVISTEKLRLLIQYAKSDISYEPKSAKYSGSARKDFMEMLQGRFKVDEQRIKTELKDINIRSELSMLFGSSMLLNVKGYNSDFNKKLTKETGLSFIWTLPVQILKTFTATYLTESIKSLLNDLVIEGFFNNPTFKTEFSSDIYAAIECSDIIKAFEDSFDKDKKFDITHIEGYMRDSHNDPDFFKKLEQMINEVNVEASKLISSQVQILNTLSKHVDQLLQDAKKPTSENISNLKVLMMSSRNRDSTDLLENQYPKWEIFFKIMKNYAIITA